MCLLLPAGLTTRQRAAVHEVASAAGLAHTSSGIDSERRLAVGNPSAPQVRISVAFLVEIPLRSPRKSFIFII